MKLFNIDNLRVGYLNIPNINSVVVMYAVNVGSRDEIIVNYGLSHYIEHMLFKGTKKYTNKQITDTLYEHGASLNAFTSQNMTGYYTKIDSKYLFSAIDVLSEMLFNSKLTKSSLEKEKDIVINENIKNRSNPDRIVVNKLNNMLFKNTTLEHNIGGVDSIIKKFNRAQVIKYINKFYNLNNMVLLIIGNIEYKYTKINNYLKKIIKKLKPSNNDFILERKMYDILISKQTEFRYNNIIMNLDESHINIGFCCENTLNLKDYCIYKIIANILGGNMSSRFFQVLRNKNSLVYSVSCNFNSENEIGYINIKLGTESNKSKILKCLELIFKELHKIKNIKMNIKEFIFNKNYLIGSLKISTTDPLDLAELLIGNFLIQNKIINVNKYIIELNNITIDDVYNKLQLLFNIETCNMVIISKTKILKHQILKLIN